MATDDQMDLKALLADVESSKPSVEEELNPAKEVVGYRLLSGDEIAWMNTCKKAELDLAAVWQNVKALVTDADPRCLAEARTCFQTGFMWLNRAIAKPEDAFDTRA